MGEEIINIFRNDTLLNGRVLKKVFSLMFKILIAIDCYLAKHVRKLQRVGLENI